MESPPLALKQLAQLLQIRKQAQARPYNLLLTSALSLTPSLLQQICGRDDWQSFCIYMQQIGINDRINVLKPLSSATQYQAGYQALARLIADGYFPTVLTTGIDSALEDALFEIGVKAPVLQVIVPYRDTDAYIQQQLYASTNMVRIVKLHGSLRDGCIPDHFPDFYALPDKLGESVFHILHGDLVIVGALAHAHDIERAMLWESKGSLYYIPAQEVPCEDRIYQLIRERGADPTQRVITGTYGAVELFFVTLESLLARNAPYTAPEKPELSFVPPALNEQHTADVLIVTVTEVETRAIFNVLKAKYGRSYERLFIGDKTYYALGVINGARVFLVQSEMGISGPGGSLLTVSEGLRALAPSAVIMVGIAFGFDALKQRIGDVLVSQQLRGYESQRYGNEADGSHRLIPRGDLVSASIRLIDRFRSGNQDWTGPARITFGLILSGEKLVDNKEFRDQLHIFEPEAIGGEMEGVGLYSVAQRYKVDWILVKAICDWADGNKSLNKVRNQKKAARNAALFTMHVLQQTKFC